MPPATPYLPRSGSMHSSPVEALLAASQPTTGQADPPAVSPADPVADSPGTLRIGDPLQPFWPHTAAIRPG